MDILRQIARADRIEAPHEVSAVAVGAALLGCYFLAVVNSGYIDAADFADLLRFYLTTSFSLWMFVGFGGLLWLLWKNRPRGGVRAASPMAVISGWVAGRWKRDRLVTLFWPPLLFAMLIASFNAFKQQILVTRPFVYDDAFAAMDRALFFGQDGWQVAHGLFGSPFATRIIDMLYHGWFVPMAIGVILCAFIGMKGAGGFRGRTQYLLSYLLVWTLIGSGLAWLFPAAGPCFYTDFIGPSDSFAQMMATLRVDGGSAGLSALNNMAVLKASFGSDSLAMGGGISAMPSVHNGLAVLFALGAGSINRRLGQVMAFYAFMIWFGSVYLGWHYAVDGIVAAILTIGIWVAMGRLADWLVARHNPISDTPKGPN